MAVGGVVGANDEGSITIFVLVACIVAAMGGLLFGYDFGVSGGVTSMPTFFNKFFPSVYGKMKDESSHENVYCKFDSHSLTLFASSPYLAALIASFCASTITRKFGRKISMVLGGLFFLIGSIFNSVANGIALLIVGRLLVGIGIGFSSQSVPVYLSEMAPRKMRGALNMGFQMAINIGGLVANLVNVRTAKINGGWGWRVSLALAAIPAMMMTVGSFFLPNTPNSILERGKVEEAKKVLQRARGTDDVDKEYQDLLDANKAAKKVDNPWKNILQPRYRPHLVMCTLIPFFRQLTGIIVIVFYFPIFFMTLGFNDKVALISAVIIGGVGIVVTLISIFTVDKFGRRVLFLEGGLQMTISQIAIGIIIGVKLGLNGEETLTKFEANFILFLICMYVAAFAWSWGPLGWLVPSEICPLEIRSAGQAINVSINMFFTFVIAQVFLSILCHMKFRIFFFFSGFVIIMTIFIYFFLPEMKNLPIEEMNNAWKFHWFWGKYIPEEAI